MAEEPKTDDQKTDDPSPAMIALQTELATLRQEIADTKASSSTTADLMRDSAVREVLALRDAGADVVVQAKDSTPKTVDTSKVDFDELTTKEAYELSQEASKLLVQGAQDSRVDAIMDEVKGLSATMKQLLTHHQAGTQESLKAEVAVARKKYADFDKFNDEMDAIFKADKSGTLSVDEIYLIAKKRKTGTLGAPESDATERPGSTTARPTGLEGTEKHPATLAGFKQILKGRKSAAL